MDMSQWRFEKHFSSWLGLSPAKTSEKVFSTKSRKVINRASTAFRIAIVSAGKTQTALGAFMRRIKIGKGTPKAILQLLERYPAYFIKLLKFRQAYVEQGMTYYEQTYKAKLVYDLEKRAKELGYT